MYVLYDSFSQGSCPYFGRFLETQATSLFQLDIFGILKLRRIFCDIDFYAAVLSLPNSAYSTNLSFIISINVSFV